MDYIIKCGTLKQNIMINKYPLYESNHRGYFILKATMRLFNNFNYIDILPPICMFS